MSAVRRLFYGLTGLAAAVLVGAQFGLLEGSPPVGLGVAGGRLQPPSSTPNSVSSQARLYQDHPQRAYASIDPLPLKHGNPVASMRTLVELLQTTPGLTLVEQGQGYVHAQAQTRWLKFVDDLEFWFNPAAGVIELRSASRLDRKDFGVNRQRIEAIRQAYLARP